MRFSLVISVLGLSLAAIATPVVQPQPDQSLITCKNKLNDGIRYSSILKNLAASEIRKDPEEMFKIKADLEKDLQDAFGECMKVAQVSSKEAAEVEDLIIKVLGDAEDSSTLGSIDDTTIKNVITVYKHFHVIYPENYKKSLNNPFAGTSPSPPKFPDLCNHFSFCIYR